MDIKINDLVGARFINRGRSSREGFDCYGLAIEVSRRFGHELPDLWYERSSDETFSENAESVIKKLSSVVKEIKEPDAGDLVVFSDENGDMVHIGVMLDRVMFIHAELGGVHVSRLSSYFRKSRRIYRWLP